MAIIKLVTNIVSKDDASAPIWRNKSETTAPATTTIEDSTTEIVALRRQISELEQRLRFEIAEKGDLSKKISQLESSTLAVVTKLRREVCVAKEEKDRIAEELKAFDLDFFEEIDNLKNKVSR